MEGASGGGGAAEDGTSFLMLSPFAGLLPNLLASSTDSGWDVMAVTEVGEQRN